MEVDENAYGSRGVGQFIVGALVDKRFERFRVFVNAVNLGNFRMTSNDVLPLYTKRVDWDTKARVLTDQYSPANLLNSR